jgi:hypothetical protein
MSGYSSKSLLDKLGIKSEMSLLFINAPQEYFDVLGELPKSTKLPHEKADFIHAFYTKKSEFIKDISLLIKTESKNGFLWVSWPKKAQNLILSDLTEQDFRDALLPYGLVDVKVCAVTDVWSGLKFVWRKS